MMTLPSSSLVKALPVCTDEAATIRESDTEDRCGAAIRSRLTALYMNQQLSRKDSLGSGSVESKQQPRKLHISAVSPAAARS